MAASALGRRLLRLLRFLRLLALAITVTHGMAPWFEESVKRPKCCAIAGEFARQPVAPCDVVRDFNDRRRAISGSGGAGAILCRETFPQARRRSPRHRTPTRRRETRTSRDRGP